eukprot:3234417-Prymnesium_polylepis.1
MDRVVRAQLAHGRLSVVPVRDQVVPQAVAGGVRAVAALHAGRRRLDRRVRPAARRARDGRV